VWLRDCQSNETPPHAEPRMAVTVSAQPMDPDVRPNSESGGAEALGTLLAAVGLLLLFAGAYYLLNPTVPVELTASERVDLMAAGVQLPESVVNFQRLAWGITGSVVGAVIFAVGMLPFLRTGER